MGKQYVVGIDEAGRGPLAGPVAVGIVRAPTAFDFLSAFPGLNDSKQLTENKREGLFEVLQKHVAAGEIAYRVVCKSPQAIDQKGIAVVIREAVAEGIVELLPDPLMGKVWLDGALCAPDTYEQETVIGGDGIVPAIMLASIAAKVTRDRYMVKIARQYPSYGFERHKGYGTKAHRDAIQTHGQCAIHRTSFIHLDRNAIQA